MLRRSVCLRCVLQSDVAHIQPDVPDLQPYKPYVQPYKPYVQPNKSNVQSNVTHVQPNQPNVQVRLLCVKARTIATLGPGTRDSVPKASKPARSIVLTVHVSWCSLHMSLGALPAALQPDVPNVQPNEPDVQVCSLRRVLQSSAAHWLRAPFSTPSWLVPGSRACQCRGK